MHPLIGTEVRDGPHPLGDHTLYTHWTGRPHLFMYRMVLQHKMATISAESFNTLTTVCANFGHISEIHNWGTKLTFR